MGEKPSVEKIDVAVSLPEGSCRVDAIHLYYTKRWLCVRRQRRIASFKFPEAGWTSARGVQACLAAEALCVSRAALHRKDGALSVKVVCVARGRRLIKGHMSLERLLACGDYLHFSLFKGGEDDGATFAALHCNGWRCGAAVGPAPQKKAEAQARDERAPAELETPPSNGGAKGEAAPFGVVTPASNGEARGEGASADAISPAPNEGANDGEDPADYVSRVSSVDGASNDSVSAEQVSPLSKENNVDKVAPVDNVSRASSLEDNDGVTTEQVTPGSKEETVDTRQGAPVYYVPRALDQGTPATIEASCDMRSSSDLLTLSSPGDAIDRRTVRDLACPNSNTRSPRRRVRGSRATRARRSPRTWDSLAAGHMTRGPARTMTVLDVLLDGAAVLAVVASTIMLYYEIW